MNHRHKNQSEDDLKTIRELKSRFDALGKELRDIHQKWQNLHGRTSDEHLELHNELIHQELEVYGELHLILKSVAEVLRRSTERVR